MALTIVKVQDSRVALGPGLWQDSILIIPGTSDYATNGYPITTTLTGFAKIQSAWMSGANSTATGYTVQPVFAFAEVGSSGPGFSGYAQFLWKVFVITTGVEVTSSGNLTGCIWECTIQGY